MQSQSSCLALWIISVSIWLSGPDARAQEPGADRTRDFNDLIDAVASRNKEPKLEKTPWDLGDKVPLFDKDYDWADQSRVLEAVGKLCTLDGDELWPRLVEHMNDTRYSLTKAENYWVENVTVGDFCGEIAFDDLRFPFDRYLMRLPPGELTPDERAVLRAMWGPPELEDLKAWRRARNSRPLHELQIELCLWSIDTMQSLKEASAAQKAEFTANVERQIERIRASKLPIVRGRNAFAERYDLFNAKSARRGLKEYAEAQAADHKSEK